ncbi:MAG: pyrroline-5-carboxylate reductase [Candidatus Omnitrophota bacterium]|nr:pyrroline-5-carboxylate reductase [Candidatus Omnitrophota bacterium]
MINKKIGIIGCGNMGEAILSRLSNVLEKSVSIMVSEFDFKRRNYVQSKYKVIVETDNNEVVKFADVIILAVKPKDLGSVLKNEVCCGASKDKLLISIAAGITTKYIESIVGKDVPVIRVMPNMAATIGESISSISAGSAVGSKDMELAKEIFLTVGDVVEVDEKLIDAVTAISGSGPAYFFYMVEALIEAGCAAGLKEDIAKKLVLKTALGSAKLLETLKEDPAALRSRVTSKGGTTEAAIKVFESKKFKKIIKDAVRAAKARSKELQKR